MATPDHSQANGMLCWLRCDEAGGDLLDASARRYDAQANGNITYQQTGVATLGLGYGISPTDANAVATIQRSADIYWNTLLCGFLSVQVWFKPAMAFASMWGAKHALAYKSSANGDNYGWFLGVLPGGGNTISFRIMDAATSTYTASYTETDFVNWHHYVGTFDGSYVRLYRDGVQVAQTFVSGTIGHSTSYLTTIGEGIQGVIDDIAIWNRALTAAEVLDLYGQTTYGIRVSTIDVGEIVGDRDREGIATDALYRVSVVIGPFPYAVQVRSGDHKATAGTGLTSANDQIVVNGSNWTTPAWVNVSTPHVIAPGTVIATLTPGQTCTIQVRSKAANNVTLTNFVSVFRQGVAASGLNIVTYIPTSEFVASGPNEDVATAPYDPAMNDMLVEPADTRFPLFDTMAIPGEFDTVVSIGQADAPNGIDQAFPVFENVPIDPLPAIVSVTADGGTHVVTLVGSAGPTNLPYLDLYWQVEFDDNGMLTIPVSTSWEPFTLATRQSVSVDFAMPMGTFLDGKRVRFAAEANGPGAGQNAIRYYSPWLTLSGASFNFPFPSSELYNGAQVRNLTNQAVTVEWLYSPTGTMATVVIAPQASYYIPVMLPNGSPVEALLPRTWTLAKTGRIAVYWNGQWWSGNELPPFARPG